MTPETTINVSINANKEKVTALTPEIEEMLKTMSIREQLYKVSPEVNRIVFNNFLKEHRKDFGWLTPVAAFGIAGYLVKAKVINLDILQKVVKEKLGIELDANAIKRFGANVGIASAVFAGVKIGGKLLSGKKDKKNLLEGLSLKNVSFTKINETINEAKSLKSLKPKAEELLPISLSIIVLFIITRPVKEIKALSWAKEQFYAVFGGFAYTVSETVDNAIIMLASKMNLDTSEEDDVLKIKKFIIFMLLAVILLYAYGKNVAKNDSKKKELRGFFSQLLTVINAVAPAAFATIVAIGVERKIFTKEDIPEDIHDEVYDKIETIHNNENVKEFSEEPGETEEEIEEDDKVNSEAAQVKY